MKCNFSQLALETSGSGKRVRGPRMLPKISPESADTCLMLISCLSGKFHEIKILFIHLFTQQILLHDCFALDTVPGGNHTLIICKSMRLVSVKPVRLKLGDLFAGLWKFI